MPEKSDKLGKIIEADKPVVVKLGESTMDVTSRLGGEPEEVAKVLAGNERHKQLKEEYEPIEQQALEVEYRRINSDFDLAMKNQDRLQAILGVLVSKYHIDDQSIRKLRE